MKIQGDLLDSGLISRFATITGERYALREAVDIAPHIVEPRGLYGGASQLVLKPGSVDEISRIMRLATEHGVPVVPQGGNTGLVGGQMPDASGQAIILSLSRLNKIREFDLSSNTVTAEAGVVLHELQTQAHELNRLFPLSLASEGSCQIGGNLSSNAGGIGALSYGVARDLCLGLEVVLPTGEVLDDLRKLKKDNRGYDLKNLFIGAEGTLGIITAAVLKLFPMPRGRELAWVGLDSPERALQLLGLATERAGSALTMFELMHHRPLDFVLKHVPGTQAPFGQAYPWNVLIEISSGRSIEDAQGLMEEILADGLEAGWMNDAIIAQNEGQREKMLALREHMSDAQKPEGGSIKHDISVPVAAIPEFIDRAALAVEEVVPGARIVCFGHMGDGNLHYNISQPEGAEKIKFLASHREMNDAVHGIVHALDGSFSAEHGIGSMKRQEFLATEPPVAIALMQKIKASFDPAGIMNPGKII